MRSVLALFLLLLPVASVVAAPIKVMDAQTLQVSVGERSVVASGSAADSRIAWFGVVREPSNFASRIVVPKTIAVSDSHGVSRFESDKPLSPRAVWVAVDMTTGAYGVGIPAEGTAQPFNDFPDVLKNWGQSKKIVASHALVDVMLVRPGVGAWTMRTGDGFDSDDDRNNNGVFTAGFDSLRSVGTSPVFQHKIEKGDVLVLIDSRTLEYFISRVGEK
jgi:hypothetical protein